MVGHGFIYGECITKCSTFEQAEQAIIKYNDKGK